MCRLDTNLLMGAPQFVRAEGNGESAGRICGAAILAAHLGEGVNCPKTVFTCVYLRPILADPIGVGFPNSELRIPNYALPRYSLPPSFTERRSEGAEERVL